MKQIACTFEDSYYRLTRCVYIIVDDEYNMYGSFVDNHTYHQMKKSEKKEVRPISDMLNDGYGKKIFDKLNESNSVYGNKLTVEEISLCYIKKD